MPSDASFDPPAVAGRRPPAPRVGAGARGGMLAACMVCVLACRAAAAEPTATERATARRLLLEGAALQRAGNANAALEPLRAADAIMGVPTTALALARAEIATHLLVEASESLGRAKRWRGAAPVPEPFRKAQAEATRLLAELAPRIPTLRIVLRTDGAARDDLDVRLDGRKVPPAALAQPYAVDPGEHHLSLTAGDVLLAERRVTLAEGESAEAELAPPPRAQAVTPGAPAPQGPSPTELPSRSVAVPPTPEGAVAAPTRAPIARAARTAGLAVAGAGLVVGATAGIFSLVKAHDARSQCVNGQCLPPSYATLDQASAAATVSDVAFVAAGAGAVVAVVAWLWPERSAPTAPASAWSPRSALVSPWRTADATGVGCVVPW